MQLSRINLQHDNGNNILLPDEALFELPEKVLQFGTGVLLRGLPDYFIDKANRKGIFNGRIVLVKSTSTGDLSSFEKQDCLYTLCVRGIENGTKVEDNIICSAISRVLSALEEWPAVLKCAHNPQMQIIISNTTEVGIQLVSEDFRKHPPVSFPAKLLAFLYERYIAFNGSCQSGMVIVPTELITNNAKKLTSIVLELAHLNGLNEQFIEWLTECNYFCNSLVDRIVPGYDKAISAEVAQATGLQDDLLIVSEVHRLWAIEGNETVRKVLSFAEADDGMLITDDIELFKELKLRLLNATHTLCCGVALLYGLETVKQGMDDKVMSNFITSLMLQQIAPAIPYTPAVLQAEAFGNKVLERFSNPFIQHQWLSITMNYTHKLKVRVLPLLQNYYATFKIIPEGFITSFAAYLLFMKAVKQENGSWIGHAGGKDYLINDEQASLFFDLWQKLTVSELVNHVMKDRALWDVDLTDLPGFKQAVLEKLNRIITDGMSMTLQTTPVSHN